jgi:hypothetical protein
VLLLAMTACSSASPAAPTSQPKSVTIGLAEIGQIGPVISLINGFKEEMAALCDTEGSNLTAVVGCVPEHNRSVQIGKGAAVPG